MTDQGVEYKVSITQNGSILGPGEDDSQDFMELQPELVQGNKAGGGVEGRKLLEGRAEAGSRAKKSL
jgi:hypothetical protein